jgi:phospholipid/cholesterol/gamma-HCH transport system ATP-binding protein
MNKLNQEDIINKNETVISIKGLYKSFGELDVLKGIDLTVFKGENVAVLGKSGSGKSVLIKLMVGLLKPDKGEIIVLDKNVAELNQKELDALRLRIGFSFQSSALYDSMSVYQNLAFPLTMNVKNLTKTQVDDAVEEALDAVGLKSKINEMPADLSGGQRKRIGIARTLILKPEIMLYDEPTSGLDPVTSAEINALINDVQTKYKTSSVIITHDLTCAKNTCNRVAMLIDGQFLKIGTFDDVFNKKLNTKAGQINDFFTYNFIQ